MVENLRPTPYNLGMAPNRKTPRLQPLDESMVRARDIWPEEDQAHKEPSALKAKRRKKRSAKVFRETVCATPTALERKRRSAAS